jgi:lipopolysaccharide biosynthesis protein
MGEIVSELPQESYRRCILFAAYYNNSTVDDIDLSHLKELSQHGDVYYCVDSDNFSPTQIERVMAYTKHVIAKFHGEYDFGSWKLLIKEIGWEALETYDEVIFVNNSVILIGDLSGMLATAKNSSAKFFAPLLIDEHYQGPALLLEDYLHRNNIYYSSAMFSSFFWVVKKSLIEEPFFRNFILGVEIQKDRIDVCYKYERGFTRSLFRHNISFSVLIDRVFRMSSIYTDDAFHLISVGLPYLKRKVLTEDFYNISFFESRVEGLLKRLPDAQVAQIKLLVLTHKKART